MQSKLSNHNKIMDIFKPYKFTDIEGHPLLNCVEFQKLIVGYCQVESLQKQLAEKDAMIDWLVSQPQDRCDNENMCSFCMHGYRFAEYDKDKCHNKNWKKAAQEAVKKNGSS